MTELPSRRSRRRKRRTSRPQNLSRQLQVLEVLVAEHGHPISVKALARRVRSSERTVERDLESLRDARLPLRGRGGSGGGVWIEVTRGDKALRLDDVTVMGLVLALGEVDALPQQLLTARERLLKLLDDPTLF